MILQQHNMEATLALVLQAALIGAALALALFGDRLGSRLPPSPPPVPPPPPPPTLPGLPLLGNCLALGRSGAAVLRAARREHGDAFAVRAFPLAPPLVFVFHPRAVAAFFAAPEETLAFKPAVRRFTERVFGLPAGEFSSAHVPLLEALRALLSPAPKLRAHAAAIAARAAPMLDEWAAQAGGAGGGGGDGGGAGDGEGDGDGAGAGRGGVVGLDGIDNDDGGGGGKAATAAFDLWPRVRSLVFRAAGGALFGERFFARHGAGELERRFLEFEGGFERAAAPLPQALLPAFRRGRRALLAALARSLDAGDFEGTAAGELAACSGVRPRLRPNLLLSVLWASQANSMPALFWSLAFLLLPENAGWLARVRGAPDAAGSAGGASGRRKGAGGVGGAGELEAVLEAALDPSGPAQRVANEAIRARAHSIAIRLVPNPRAAGGGGGGGGFDVPVAHSGARGDKAAAAAAAEEGVVRVPAGCVLAVCPFETHADARFFPDGPSPAGAFDPDRAGTPALPGGGVVGMGFGGGQWRCPGRLFAGMELALLLTMAVRRLDLRIVGAGAAAAAGSDKVREGGPKQRQRQQKQQRRPQPQRAPWERAAAALLGEARARYGLGVGLADDDGPAGLADAPAAPHPLLPRPDVSRLVGFKVPAGPLVVTAARRRRKTH